ncbi:sulfurtransferase [Photobacterium sp. J15]|uniref:sulfurtransferase n=1 Tax=Photobacterium sp. J15 TaxID=265901 RepID=UPI0007E318C6|nr:rhodanese-like domain-containing protein [Photobacterium sp. J15]
MQFTYCFVATWIRLLLIVALSFLGANATATEAKYFVSADWLIERLGRDDVIIYDARPEREYLNGHIPGAVSFPVNDTYHVNNDVYYVKNKENITPLLRKKGLDKNKLVIIYDNGNYLDSSRLFWVLELYGHRNLAILETGYSLWLQEYPVSTEITFPDKTSYIPIFNSAAYASTLVAKVATYSPDYQLYDSRTLPEYEGNRSVTHVYGHIPRARHLSIGDFFTASVGGVKVLKSQSEIALVLSDFDKSKKNITYCNKGKASTLSYYLLKRSGFDVAHYDGSWLDWSAKNLPTER